MTTLRITTEAGARVARRGRGVTLVELLVVLAIIAVMAGVLVPNMRGSLKGVRLREAALTLAEHVRYAQMLAIKADRPVRVVIERERRWYQVQKAEDALGRRFSATTALGTGFVVLTEGVEFDAIEAGAAPDGGKDSLWFEPTAAWSAGKVRLTDGERRLEVRVRESAGGVEVIDPDREAHDHERAEEAALLATPMREP